MDTPSTISKSRPTFAVIVLAACLGTTTSTWSAPRLIAEVDASTLGDAVQNIRARIKNLRTPTPATLDKVEEDLERIKSVLARYFHATNQTTPEIRPTVLRIRQMVQSLRKTPDPILVIHHDAFGLSAAIHRRLARANTALKRDVVATAHLRRAQAIEATKSPSPTPPIKAAPSPTVDHHRSLGPAN